VIERRDAVMLQERGEPAPCVTQRRSKEMAGHPEHVRHGARGRDRVLWRLHVESRTLVQQRAADAAPVEPPAKVALPGPRRANHVSKGDLRPVAPPQSRRARANAPFADLLAEQGAGLAPRIRIEHPRTLEGAAAKRHVYAERYAGAELNRVVAIIEQRHDGPVLPAVIGKPRRPLRFPDG